MNTAKKNPCFTCADGDCADCLNSPENSVPVRLHTPKGAARAMLAGRILHGEGGLTFFWGEDGNGAPGFWFRDKEGGQFPVRDFSGLWEEL
jgi:hypothetical protein